MFFVLTTKAYQENYLLSRVDKCLQMLANVFNSQTLNPFKCAFPGGKLSGKWVLEYARKVLLAATKLAKSLIHSIQSALHSYQSTYVSTSVQLFPRNGDRDICRLLERSRRAEGQGAFVSLVLLQASSRGNLNAVSVWKRGSR